MNIEQWVSIISDLALAVSAIIVALIAAIGLNTWRRELKGRVLFDDARKIVRLSIEVYANFEWARFPLGSSSESLARQRAEGESATETQIRDSWFAKYQRLKPLMTTMQSLQEMDWEIQTLLGDRSKRISNAIKIYRASYAELKVSIDEYFEIKVNEAIKESPYHDQDYLRELSHVIYGTSSDDFGVGCQ